jgi:hypothetical protein
VNLTKSFEKLGLLSNSLTFKKFPRLLALLDNQIFLLPAEVDSSELNRIFFK